MITENTPLVVPEAPAIQAGTEVKPTEAIQPRFDLFQHIPLADRGEFFTLPVEAQEQVKFYTEMMVEMDRAGSANAGAANIAARFQGRREGCSTQNLRRRHAEWIINGWRACYDRARWGHLLREDLELHADAERKVFLEFVAAFFQQNQRKCKPGYRKFLRHWYAGGSVPGYGTWREYWAKHGQNHLHACPRCLPHGWGYNNLIKLAKPPKIELALARQGTAAAIALLPPIPGTRDGLRPLEFVTWDDVDRDRKLYVPGYSIPVRLMMLANRCMASAKFLRAGCRPQLPNEIDPTKKQRLRASDMKLLLAVTLMDFGYPRDYISHYVLENGTATLLQAEAWALYQVTQGHVVCTYAQMEGGLVLAWDEKSKGNSRSKAGHESDHNRLHNDSADQRGQVGKDRDHSPAHLAIMERESVALAKIQSALAPSEAARLRLPFDSLEDGIAQAYRDLDLLNTRTDHRLEGFQRTLQWKLKGELDWRPRAELVNWLNQIGKTFEEVHPSLIEINPTPRLETPNERWSRLCEGIEFVKPPFAAIQSLLEDHKLCKVECGRIKFTLDGRTFEYWPERTEDVLLNYTDDKRHYLGWFVPYAMDYLILTTEDGGYAGTWRRMKIARLDPAALAAAIQTKKTILKTAITNVRRRDTLLPDSRMVQRNADLDLNLRVLSENGFLDQHTILPASASGTLDAAGDPSPETSHRADSNPCESTPTPAAPVPPVSTTTGITARPPFEIVHRERRRLNIDAAAVKQSDADRRAREENRRAKRAQFLTEQETF